MAEELEGVDIGRRADEFALWLLKVVESNRDYGRVHVFTTPAVTWQGGPVMGELEIERLREVLGIFGCKYELVQENAFIWNAKVFSFDKEKLGHVVDKIEMKKVSRSNANGSKSSAEPSKLKA